MKIDYCSLDQMRYNPRTGRWHKGRNTYEYREACANCGEPFLAAHHNKGVICSHECQSGRFAPGYKDGRTADPVYQAAQQKVRSKAHREANKAEITARQKAWREANKAEVASKKRAWKRANPDKVNASRAKRRAAKLQQAPQEASQVMLEWLYGVAKLVEKSTGEAYHVDHVVPLSSGGEHRPSNLQVITARENLSKHDTVGLAPTGITVEAINKLLVENGVCLYRRLQVPLARQIAV